MLQAIVDQSPDERLFLIEDTGEIQCRAPNSVAYVATTDFSLTRAVRTAMRMNPDRVIVGEVRGRETASASLVSPPRAWPACSVATPPLWPEFQASSRSRASGPD